MLGHHQIEAPRRPRALVAKARSDIEHEMAADPVEDRVPPRDPRRRPGRCRPPPRCRGALGRPRRPEHPSRCRRRARDGVAGRFSAPRRARRGSRSSSRDGPSRKASAASISIPIFRPHGRAVVLAVDDEAADRTGFSLPARRAPIGALQGLEHGPVGRLADHGRASSRIASSSAPRRNRPRGARGHHPRSRRPRPPSLPGRRPLRAAPSGRGRASRR